MIIFTTYWYVWGSALGVAIALFVHSMIKISAERLNKKFISLGNMTGKSYNEIVSVVGRPVSIEKTLAKNTQKWVKIVTWSRGKYSMVIMFDNNDRCDHIISQGYN